MKSGRNWGRLGMKSEWNIGTISEVCSLVTDGSHYSPKSCDNGEYMVSVKDFKGFGFDFSNCKHISSSDYEKMKASGCIPECGDILIGKDGARFFEDIIIYNQPEKPALLSSIAILRCNSDIILPQFLYYICKNPVFKKDVRDNYGSGSAIPRIVLKDFKRMPISYPDLDEQRRIVASLVAIDDRILLNTAINENLESQAQAIFEYMFPNVIYGEHSIGEYITPKRGKGLLSKNAIFGDVPVVAGGLEPATYHNIANTIAPVLTISASGANSGYVNLWTIPVWSSDSSFIDSSMTNNVYFWYVMLKIRQQEIYDSQTGSAQPHIYPKHISVLPITKLNEKDISNFTQIVAPMFDKIGKNKCENKRLAALRDTLLPKLMNGEIDVSEVKI